MTRAEAGRGAHGILLVDKPAGLTSAAVVARVKRVLGGVKVGHLGTLDPFATGLLPICLGEGTKLAPFVQDATKRYVGEIVLGVETDTLDGTGAVVATHPVGALGPADLARARAALTGEIMQVPPMYSALKHEGKPLYRLAREGREVERDAREVTIHSLVLESWQPPRLIFRVECSKGTYVRTLAEDLAKALGSCAHLESLRRLSVTPFDPDAMVTLEVLEAAGVAGRQLDYLLPTDAGLEHWPKAEITEGQAARFRHGNPVIVDDQQPGMVRVYEQGGRILGIGETRTDNQTYPKRIFLLD